MPTRYFRFTLVVEINTSRTEALARIVQRTSGAVVRALRMAFNSAEVSVVTAEERPTVG